MGNCKIRTSSLTSCQLCIRKVISEKNSVLMATTMLRKVISEKNSALMATTMLNKHTKFGAKILGVGSFFLDAPTAQGCQRLNSLRRSHTFDTRQHTSASDGLNGGILRRLAAAKVGSLSF